MKQLALDSSLEKLSSDVLTLQVGCAESPLASFLYLWRKFRWVWLRNDLSTIALQAPSDRTRGELRSDSRTLISH